MHPDTERWTSLAHRLSASIRLGTSSWSFPGWAGLVYDREVDKKVLARHGLAAYARHPLLRAVGVDRGYYEPVPESVYRQWADAVPDHFRFVVKATRGLVTPGDPTFLDAALARDDVIGPVHAGLGHKVGSVLFQFPPVPPSTVGGPRRFAEALYRFLVALDAPVPVAVEIRTPGWLTPDYGAALRHARATHGWVVHPRMADLARQREVLGPVETGPTVIRWMLAPGQRYEGARDAWSPFDQLQAPDPVNRAAVASLATEATAAGPVYVVVNNKAEGSSPASIEALARHLAGEAETAP